MKEILVLTKYFHSFCTTPLAVRKHYFPTGYILYKIKIKRRVKTFYYSSSHRKAASIKSDEERKFWWCYCFHKLVLEEEHNIHDFPVTGCLVSKVWYHCVTTCHGFLFWRNDWLWKPECLLNREAAVTRIAQEIRLLKWFCWDMRQATNCCSLHCLPGVVTGFESWIQSCEKPSVIIAQLKWMKENDGVGWIERGMSDN